jgi:putative thioredoxin
MGHAAGGLSTIMSEETLGGAPQSPVATTDVTDATFERDVLDRSTEVPVVVDLWAAWCGPCRTLGPILERVVEGTDGRVALAKVDVDANPRISATFSVQSIPAVYALRDRRVVDSFIGALPEPAVQAFVDKLAPAQSAADRLVARGDEASLRQALELQSDHPAAVVALAELLAGRGAAEEALALLTRLPETGEVRRVAALARVGAGAGPDDHDIDRRLEALLDRVKDEEGARQEFVDLLELLGSEDPRTPRYRRALASRLF